MTLNHFSDRRLGRGSTNQRSDPPIAACTGVHGGCRSRTLCYTQSRLSTPRTGGYELHTERHLTCTTRSSVRLRRINMTERFVVLPVAQGCDIEQQELNHHENNRQQLSPVFGGEGDLDEPEAVPILQYNREPNKYGSLYQSPGLPVACWAQLSHCIRGKNKASPDPVVSSRQLGVSHRCALTFENAYSVEQQDSDSLIDLVEQHDSGSLIDSVEQQDSGSLIDSVEQQDWPVCHEQLTFRMLLLALHDGPAVMVFAMGISR
ncbi:hypothetical protein Baya_0943 [Bagarius yarrelli]|uniref:Uncharacterized protein n=1 Tax=Bagarius yarrelli TaxID=175774 RepID=A0A556TJP3_BAGYA|nr:hypothetical protein Baya_0943 [Bagarius yarrelli]